MNLIRPNVHPHCSLPLPRLPTPFFLFSFASCSHNIAFSFLIAENNRILESLYRQVREGEKEERRLERRARAQAALEAGEEVGSEFDDTSEESEYSTEDEDGSLMNPQTEAQVLKTITLIRSRDPSIYDKNAVYFSDPEDSSDDDEEQRAKKKAEKKQKKMTLGHLIAEQARKGIAAEDSEDEEDEAAMLEKLRVTRKVHGQGRHATIKTHAEEMDEIKQAFIKSMAGQDEASKKKKKGGAEDDDDDEDDGDALFGTARSVYMPGQDDEEEEEEEGEGDKDKDASKKAAPSKKSKKSSAAEGVKAVVDDVSAQEQFLRDFMTKGWWNEKTATNVPDARAILGIERGKSLEADKKAARKRRREEDGEDGGGADDEEEDGDGVEYDADADDALLDEVDRFEAQHNFRFEEPGANEITSFPRSHLIQDSLRRETNSTRKLARQRKAERLKAEKERKQEEIKRLKNVRKQAILERMNLIAKVSGAKIVSTEDDVDADAATWGAGVGEGEDMEKPNFDDEDDDAMVEAMKKKALAQAQASVKNSKKNGKNGKKNVLTAADLLGEYDPKEHARRMAEIFNDEFYSDLKEEDIDAEEERLRDAPVIEGLEAYDDEDESKRKEKKEKKGGENGEDDDGTDDEEIARAKRETELLAKSVKKKERQNRDEMKRALHQVFEAENAEGEAEYWLKKKKEELLMKAHGLDADNTDFAKGGKKKFKINTAELDEEAKELLRKELEKLDELDQEDVIAGTRYGYQQVEPNDFGIPIEDMLFMDDKDLNQLISIKKLAPYRDDIPSKATWWEMKGRKAKPTEEEMTKWLSNKASSLNSVAGGAGAGGKYQKNAGGPGGAGGKHQHAGRPNYHQGKQRYGQGLGFRNNMNNTNNKQSKSPFQTDKKPMDQAQHGRNKKHRPM